MWIRTAEEDEVICQSLLYSLAIRSWSIDNHFILPTNLSEHHIATLLVSLNMVYFYSPLCLTKVVCYL